MTLHIEILTADELRDAAPFVHEVVVAMPAIDSEQAKQSANLMSRRAGAEGILLVIIDEQRKGYVSTINLAFSQSRSRYFVYTAQDAFAGRVWLRVALNQILKTSKDLLAFNDGKWHGLIASFGMVRREWVESLYPNSLFHPGYHAHYADVELSLIARAQERMAYAARSVMVEVDWNKDERRIRGPDLQYFMKRRNILFDGVLTDPSQCEIFPFRAHSSPHQASVRIED